MAFQPSANDQPWPQFGMRVLIFIHGGKSLLCTHTWVTRKTATWHGGLTTHMHVQVTNWNTSMQVQHDDRAGKVEDCMPPRQLSSPQLGPPTVPIFGLPLCGL